MDKDEVAHRQLLIDHIEAYTGSLPSLPYSQMTTEDIEKLHNGILCEACEEQVDKGQEG